MIRIFSRKKGFRRCGIVHDIAPKDYPDDQFTEAELEQLRNEPMLVVQVLPDKAGDDASGTHPDNAKAGDQLPEGSGDSKSETKSAIAADKKPGK